MEKLLKEYGGHVDAIFTSGEPTSYAAMRISAAMPPESRPYMVGFDWRPEFQTALEQGVIYSTTVPDAYGIGYQAVETLLTAMQNRPTPARQYVKVATITINNVNDPSIKKMLAHYGWQPGDE